MDNTMTTQNIERKVYLADDIAELLGIGRSKTYQFLDEAYKTQPPFRVIKVGKLVRVPKESFDKWLYGEQGRM